MLGGRGPFLFASVSYICDMKVRRKGKHTFPSLKKQRSPKRRVRASTTPSPELKRGTVASNAELVNPETGVHWVDAVAVCPTAEEPGDVGAVGV